MTALTTGRAPEQLLASEASSASSGPGESAGSRPGAFPSHLRIALQMLSRSGTTGRRRATGTSLEPYRA